MTYVQTDQYIIPIPHVYQYVLRRYRMHMYVMGTGMYICIYHFFAHVPDNPIPIFIGLDLIPQSIW